MFELFSKFACISASTAAVERLFSFLSSHTMRYKSNSKPELVRMKVICSFNKAFIQ